MAAWDFADIYTRARGPRALGVYISKIPCSRGKYAIKTGNIAQVTLLTNVTHWWLQKMVKFQLNNCSCSMMTGCCNTQKWAQIQS